MPALSPEQVKSYFYLGQIGLGALFLGVLFYFRGRQSESAFGSREADRLKPKAPTGAGKGQDHLANARLRPKAEPLRLAGIRIDGPSHEILGVARGASAADVQKAWRELMKRYHPDAIGRPGSREWTDSQKIAEAINRAKDEMLAQASHATNPKRSGR